MVNRPNRTKQFKVSAAPGMSDDQGTIYFAVCGRGVDDTFVQMERIEALFESALNAAEAYQQPVPSAARSNHPARPGNGG